MGAFGRACDILRAAEHVASAPQMDSADHEVGDILVRSRPSHDRGPVANRTFANEEGSRLGTAAVQGAIWGARAHDWANLNEPAWNPVFQTVLKKAGVEPGTRLLDIGCGAAGALAMARQSGAQVAGLDASERLVAIARERLPGARVELGEMEELPFEDGIFDVVTAINSLQFAGDPIRALSEARRVLRPGGTMLAVVWGKRDDCELIAGTASAVFALIPPNPEARAPLAWSEAGIIEGLMREAGLHPRSAGDFPGKLTFPDAEAAVGAVLSASARAIQHAGESAVADAIRKTLPRFTRTDESVVWNNRFRWVRAVRD